MSPDIDSLKKGSSIQRDSLNHQAVEDYLKTIYMLEQEESPVSTSRVASARSVKPGSATSMIQRLSKLNLVNYEKHYGVTLTESGKEIALEVIRHHRLVELYLIEALGFSWDEVHDEADLLEHVISEKLEERMAAALNYPAFDPHGDPIPSKEGRIIDVRNQLLATVPAGETVSVSRILDNTDSDLLRYLAEIGLLPGTQVTVLEIGPFEGPLTLLINGVKQIIGNRIASSILVEFQSETIKNNK